MLNSYRDKRYPIEGLIEFYRPLFVFLALISIISGFVHFYRTVNEVGWVNIASIEFDEKYSSGLLSHVMILSRLAFIFLFADLLFSKKKYIPVLLLLMFLIVFVRQVKYHIFGLVIGGLYLSIFHKLLRVPIKKLLLGVLVAFFLFIATYYVGLLVVGGDYAFGKEPQRWVFNLFFTYLFGGPIGFSEILNDPMYPVYSLKEIIGAPVNIYRFLIGEENLIDIIVHHWIPVSNNYKMFHSTNVYGMVGMLYMYLGPYLTIGYMFLSGSICYLFLGLALKLKSVIGIQLVFSFIMAFLTLSFFDLFFNKLVLYEASLYMLLFTTIYSVGRRVVRFAVVQHCIGFSKY